MAKNEFSMINFKVTPAEKATIVNNARKYANGNTSMWIRLASLTASPTQEEMVAFRKNFRKKRGLPAEHY